MENCIEPLCNYSNYRKKCIRANSYIEAIAWCKRNKKNHNECKIDYKNNKENARELACDRYYERLNIKKKPKCIDPKCHFSKYRNKCVKPNPYIEKVAYCGRIKTKRPECEGKYREDKDEAKLNACKRYNERQMLNASKIIKKVKVPKEPKVKVPKEPSLSPPKVPSIAHKISKKSSSMTPSRANRIKAFIERRAAKIIQKLTMPFINRVSADINTRITFALLLNKYIQNITSIQCLTNIGQNQFSIGDGKIKLMKQIGTESKYGVIYMSKGTNEGELYRFAVKIMKNTPSNIKEIILLELVTKIVLKNLNPHFPIMYKNYKCDKKESNVGFPKVTMASNYLLNLNEIATGDLKMFTHSTINHKEIYTSNALSQVLMAILSFHSIGFYHNDCHHGNFLYHRINPGGYFKYSLFNEEVYIENVGYLWVIWDFGFATDIKTDPSNKFTTNYHYLNDYFRICLAFLNESDKIKGWVKNEYIIPKNTKKLVNEIFNYRNHLINYGLTKEKNGEKYFISRLVELKLFKKINDLPSNAKIINTVAFKTI